MVDPKIVERMRAFSSPSRPNGSELMHPLDAARVAEALVAEERAKMAAAVAVVEATRALVAIPTVQQTREERAAERGARDAVDAALTAFDAVSGEHVTRGEHDG